MPAVGRILDANFNRAREALRVMEEAARFLLDDAELSREIKNLRHDLRTAAAASAASAAIYWRDTPGDVGTTIQADSEGQRGSAADVAIAAGKRLSEALRAIEEYAKLAPDGPALAAVIEGLRYRGYEAERRLTLALGAASPRQWRLCVLLTQALCPPARDWFEIAQACIAGGADCLQLREKSLEDGELLHRAQRLVALARPAGVSIIINDRPDIALLAGADGVHVGQGDLPVPHVRRMVGRQLLVGVSTSRLSEAEAALRDGADYCGVGPMFRTTTKHKHAIAGPDYLREYVRWGRLPHLAIGGITPAAMDVLVAAGVAGVAVSSCVCGSDDPAATCRELLKQLPS